MDEEIGSQLLGHLLEELSRVISSSSLPGPVVRQTLLNFGIAQYSLKGVSKKDLLKFIDETFDENKEIFERITRLE